MARSAFLSLAFVALAAFGLASCGSSSTKSSGTAPAVSVSSLTQARAKLSSDIAACTQTHGYDPYKATGIAENALAPGELKWRECAYQAARTYSAANPPMRRDYEQLINDDRGMTAAIQQGKMTRTERRAKVEQHLAEIKAAEQAQLQIAEDAAEADHRALTNTVETMRSFAL